MLAVAADPQRDYPGQEFGISLDIGDEREHLLVAVRQDASFVMPGQERLQPALARASCASRAARIRSKSSPA